MDLTEAFTDEAMTLFSPLLLLIGIIVISALTAFARKLLGGLMAVIGIGLLLVVILSTVAGVIHVAKNIFTGG